MSKSMSELAKEAIQVQDACNLVAVVGAFHSALLALRLNGVVSTDDIRMHPVTTMWASKIADLCGMRTDERRWTDAYATCMELGDEPRQAVKVPEGHQLHPMELEDEILGLAGDFRAEREAARKELGE